MRWLFALLIIGIIASSALAESGTSPPAFSTLKGALAFIDKELDAEDWDGLSHALYPALQPQDDNRTSWKQLKSERGKARLVIVFANQDFPDSSDTCTIGSSPQADSKMPGSTRIRFIKSADGWHLNAIYGVR